MGNLSIARTPFHASLGGESMSPGAQDSHELPPIATLLTPEERLRVDAAGEGCYRTLHRETVEDLIQDLKSRQVQAILVSVRLPAGWRELRGALMADAGDSSQRGVLSQLAVDLTGASPDCWQFFETIFTCSPRVGNVRQLSKLLDVTPSTLMSRFFRAGAPTPKRYLAMARLVRAARLFENSGFSIANVANHLDYSSPQSFGRHVRTLLHITAGEFRSRYGCAAMFNRFRSDLITPYTDALCGLHPLTPPPGWSPSRLARRS